MSDMGGKVGRVRHGKGRQHPSVRLRKGQGRVTLLEAGNACLCEDMKLAAGIQVVPGLGPQDGALPAMAASTRHPPKDQWRDINIPRRAGPIAMRKAKLHPQINAAVTLDTTREAAIRIA